MNSPEIKDYLIIEAADRAKLGDDVSNHIRLGWQPFGSPYYSNGDHKTHNQAMVKYSVVKHKTIRKTETAE